MTAAWIRQHWRDGLLLVAAAWCVHGLLLGTPFRPVADGATTTTTTSTTTTTIAYADGATGKPCAENGVLWERGTFPVFFTDERGEHMFLAAGWVCGAQAALVPPAYREAKAAAETPAKGGK